MREPLNNGYFPLDEYKQRTDKLRGEMNKTGMECILLSTETNVVYTTGLQNGYWIANMHDDTQIVLISADTCHEPVLLVADHLEQTAWTSCVSDIRVWSQFSGGSKKGAVATIADAVKELKFNKSCIGLEIGPHDRPGMSLPFLNTLKESYT